MKLIAVTFLCLCSILAKQSCCQITIAAASDLTYALSEVIASYKSEHHDAAVAVTYGSSGKLCTQITQGAPFDLFMSADISYPKQLVASGMAIEPVTQYGLGRIVLWSATLDATHMSLNDLRSDKIKHIAIADPAHAPYGLRAQEALKKSGMWDAVQPRLVFGENIAQAAQFVYSGNAEAGIIALSVALSPQLIKKGGYAMIPDSLHQPLLQAFVITAYGKKNNYTLVNNFVLFLATPKARNIMERYGFSLPKQTSTSPSIK
jgi:molybdate transport system substrate-binding protein